MGTGPTGRTGHRALHRVAQASKSVSDCVLTPNVEDKTAAKARTVRSPTATDAVVLVSKDPAEPFSYLS